MANITSIIENIKTVAVRILIPYANRVGIDGHILLRELPPGCELEDFLDMWPKLSLKERDRYSVAEHRNTLTSAGRAQVLTYLSSSYATTLGFAQQFSVGTFPINTVSPGDSAVQGEIFRATPQTATITGTQVDVSTFFGPSQANGLYTNCGLYGLAATSTLGTGTLMTHSLYKYNKVNGVPIVNDYLLNQQ